MSEGERVRFRGVERKAGFTLEGHLREASFQDGKYKDVIVMGILQSERQSANEK